MPRLRYAIRALRIPLHSNYISGSIALKSFILVGLCNIMPRTSFTLEAWPETKKENKYECVITFSLALYVCMQFASV